MVSEMQRVGVEVFCQLAEVALDVMLMTLVFGSCLREFCGDLTPEERQLAC
jgi:hypothetical protein